MIYSTNEKIKYVKGDATYPIGEGNKLIIHCCNNLGVWGKGFVLALSKRWRKPVIEYMKWYESGHHFTGGRFELGAIQTVPVEKDIVICNMIGQNGILAKDNPKPIKYDAINSCLSEVHNLILLDEEKYTVHAPRFGSGLAGGEWDLIEKLIEVNLTEKGIPVTIYDL